MQRITNFWNLHQSYEDSKFTDEGVAQEISDLMSVMRESVPSEHNGIRRIGYVALKLGRFRFGKVHVGDIVIHDCRGENIWINELPVKIISQLELFQSAIDYRIWYPVFYMRQIKMAVKNDHPAYNNFMTLIDKGVVSV